jgi:HprK-related kinase A
LKKASNLKSIEPRLNVSSFTPSEITHALKREGIHLSVGTYTIHLQSAIPSVSESISLLYADYPLNEDTSFADFHVSINHPKNVRRWIHPQAIFRIETYEPFKPLPADQAYPLLEWGLNWCVSTQYHRYLVVHAAVVEKNGRAMILPAPPGSGKSTLCAALVLRGWRLLSDELTLVSLNDMQIVPMCRPISLKNESIPIIQKYDKSVTISRPSFDTNKGTVAHMKAPKESIQRVRETAPPAWIVFPKYQPGTAAKLDKFSKASAFMGVAANAFNYSMLGAQGFQTVSKLIDRCDCYEFSYSNLDEAISMFDRLAQQ